TFLMDVDTTNAARGFDRMASSFAVVQAQNERTRQEANQLIGFGAKALGIAGVMAFGLNKAAQAASNLTEALNFANNEFGDSIGIVDKWAKSAAQSAGLSERAALQAAAGFATFG